MTASTKTTTTGFTQSCVIDQTKQLLSQLEVVLSIQPWSGRYMRVLQPETDTKLKCHCMFLLNCKMANCITQYLLHKFGLSEKNLKPSQCVFWGYSHAHLSNFQSSGHRSDKQQKKTLCSSLDSDAVANLPNLPMLAIVKSISTNPTAV